MFAYVFREVLFLEQSCWSFCYYNTNIHEKNYKLFEQNCMCVCYGRREAETENEDDEHFRRRAGRHFIVFAGGRGCETDKRLYITLLIIRTP